MVGYIRAAEVTHSWAAGWHPHCHVLLFVDRPMSPVENEDAYYALRRAHPPPVVQADGREARPHDVGGVRHPRRPGQARRRRRVRAVPDQGRLRAGHGRHQGRPRAKATGPRSPSPTTPPRPATRPTSTCSGNGSTRRTASTRSPGPRASATRSASARRSPTRSWPPKTPAAKTVAEIDRDLWRQIANRRDGARAQLPRRLRDRRRPPRHRCRRRVPSRPRLWRSWSTRRAPVPVIGLDQPTQQPQQEQHHVEHQAHRRHPADVPVLRYRPSTTSTTGTPRSGPRTRPATKRHRLPALEGPLCGRLPGRRGARRDHRHRAPTRTPRRPSSTPRSCSPVIDGQGLVDQRQPGPDLARRVLRRRRPTMPPSGRATASAGAKKRRRLTAAERQMTGQSGRRSPPAREGPRFESPAGHDEKGVDDEPPCLHDRGSGRGAAHREQHGAGADPIRVSCGRSRTAAAAWSPART